jgi:hypothetical protein
MQKKISITITLMLLLPAIAALAPPVAAVVLEDCAASDLDVLFVLDTTGSMGSVLTTVKDEASAIMSDVLSEVPNAQFGAAHYEDYAGTFQTNNGPRTYGAPYDLPWNLVQTITSNTNTVDSAIQGIGLGSGADDPESLVRALHESHQSSVGWRANSMRIVIVFTDAPGHDETFGGYDTGGDPGTDAILGTSDDLDFQTVVQDMVNDATHVIAIQSGGGAHAAAMLSHAAQETEGLHVPLTGAPNGDLGPYIRDLILAILDDFQGAKIHLLVYPAEIQQTKVFTFTGPTIGDQNLLFQELIFNEDPGFHAAMQNRIRNAGAVITWENSLESNADFVPCIGTTENPRILEGESNERSPLPSSERHVKSWTVSEMGHVMNQVSASTPLVGCAYTEDDLLVITPLEVTVTFHFGLRGFTPYNVVS